MAFARVVLEVIVSINLKSKKLIILIAVLVAVIALIVILATVFSVRNVSIVTHGFDGNLIDASNFDDLPTAKNVKDIAGGKSILFLSKEKLLEELNAKYTAWHAFAVVKNPPDIIDVHFVRREAMVKVDIGGNTVYVDSFGYVVSQPAEDNCVDISSVLEYRDASVCELGKKLQFVADESNSRLSVVLEAIIVCWRCNVELKDIPVVFGSENVFSFDDEGNFVVTTRANAQIKVIKPSNDLTNRLLKAYSVYYNDKYNLQQSGVVITVKENGNIITPNTNK